jgi:hypothetical protein
MDTVLTVLTICTDEQTCTQLTRDSFNWEVRTPRIYVARSVLRTNATDK